MLSKSNYIPYSYQISQGVFSHQIFKEGEGTFFTPVIWRAKNFYLAKIAFSTKLRVYTFFKKAKIQKQKL